MMSVANVSSAGGAATYYTKTDNYYFLGNLTAEWHGKLADEMGLEGPVNAEIFTELLHGKLQDGTVLGRDVDGKHVHRPGYDLTFSAPKSVSILALIGQDKDMQQAHKESVAVVAEYVEELASARLTVDGDTRMVNTGKIIAAGFTHDTNRNLDPQLHTHLVVMNITEQDGKYKALGTDLINKSGFGELIYKHHIALGQVYRNALKERVEQLGHEIEDVGPHGLWEIKGVPESVRRSYSTRSDEIRESVGDDASLKSKDVAAKDTRNAKQEPSRPELMDKWKDKLQQEGFDLEGYLKEVKPHSSKEAPPAIEREAINIIAKSVSLLSDTKSKFTFSDLLLTSIENSENTYTVNELKGAIDHAIAESMIIPMDSEKGIFTSKIHILDELSVEHMAKDHLKDSQVFTFMTPREGGDSKSELAFLEKESLSVVQVPASISKLRDMTENMVSFTTERGRDAVVLTSTTARLDSLSRSPELADKVIPKHSLLSNDFTVPEQSTVYVEAAEKMTLKETVVLLSHAREKNLQLVFMDSTARQANSNVLSVLNNAGAEKHNPVYTLDKLETQVVSIPDKSTRYDAIAKRFTEITSTGERATVVVTGPREQKNLTGIIRNELKNAELLESKDISMESRSPVFVTEKTRKQIGTYHSGMVIEDRTEKNRKTYTIDRVSEETKVLVLKDEKGQQHNKAIGELNADWRLFESQNIQIAIGEKLSMTTASYKEKVKAKASVTVKAITEGGVTLSVNGTNKEFKVSVNEPLYARYDYVSGAGAKDNEQGIVIAGLTTHELSLSMMNTLAQSGNRAEVFTAESQEKAESKLLRLNNKKSILTLVKEASGKTDTSESIDTLKANLETDGQKAVSLAIENMSTVSFSRLELIDKALGIHNKNSEILAEINKRVSSGQLISMDVNGQSHLVARETYEIEKSIVSLIESGKSAVKPLMEQIDPARLEGLTAGQRAATTMVLSTEDRFMGIQGYAGVGKTTQLTAVKASLDTLPENERPEIVGLGPTHRAVAEMRSVGIEAQTAKSFILDVRKRLEAGEKVNFERTLFLIDEQGMIGNQDTRDVLSIIDKASGRAVLMGDDDQLESIEAGASFRLMQDRSPMDVAIMKEIVRQQTPELREAVYSIIDNDPAKALALIEKVDPAIVPRNAGIDIPSSVVEVKIKQAQTDVESVTKQPSIQEHIAADYLSRTKEARNNTLIITQLNNDRRVINKTIHNELLNRGELSPKAIELTTLVRNSNERTAFNSINNWKAGLVVLENDSYMHVTNIDKKNGLVHMRNAENKHVVYSPKELNSRRIEVFETEDLTFNEGESIVFKKSNRDHGHTANEKYVINKIDDNGSIYLSGGNGQKVIKPRQFYHDKHIDYSYATTGYGAQGASASYVIALEGVEGSRKRMANMRGFYISASREKSHVQIYTDDREKWEQKLQQKEAQPRTAHDVLAPEHQKEKAQFLMSYAKEADSNFAVRTWMSQNGLNKGDIDVKVLNPSRKNPETRLVLKSLDNFGKESGIELVSIERAVDGVYRTTTSKPVNTQRTQANLLRTSLNNKMYVARDIEEALHVAGEDKQTGIVISDKNPDSFSPIFLKTVGIIFDKKVSLPEVIQPTITAALKESMAAQQKQIQEPAIRLTENISSDKATERALRDALAAIAKEKDINTGEQGKFREYGDLGLDTVEGKLKDLVQQLSQSTREKSSELRLSVREQELLNRAANELSLDVVKDKLERTTDKITGRSQREITFEREEYENTRSRNMDKEI